MLLLTILTLGRAGAEEIRVLPLDDRPCNMLFPAQLARIAGGRLVFPPRHLLGSFLEPGDRQALARWLQNGGGPTLVCSDMLCYGGLVASREAATSTQEALARLQLLGTLKEPPLVLASLPRLSLRTSDRQEPYEARLRTWARHPGAAHPEGVPAEVVEEYLAVRARNLEVLKRLVEMVDQGAVAGLVIGQDDSATTGLHLEEQRQLREQISSLGVEDRVTLISGLDELTMCLVARMQMCAAPGPTVRIHYSDPAAAERAAALETEPLCRMIEDHLALVGVRQSDQADFHLVVVTPEDSAGSVMPLVERLLHQNQRVGLADLSLVNRMQPELGRWLWTDLEFWRLEGLAGWNTAANAFGTVLAQAVSRHLARSQAPGWSSKRVLESEKSHLAFLVARVLDDWVYQEELRPQARRSEAATSRAELADELLNPLGPLELWVRLSLVGRAQTLFENRLKGLVVPLLDGGTAVVEQLRLEVVLPWPRTFEAELRLDLRLRGRGRVGPKVPR